MSRKGFFPPATAFRTPSASFSILAVVFFETASLRMAYSSSASERAFAFGRASRASSSSAFSSSSHLRRRDLVGDLQELPLDRAGLPSP